MAGERADLGLPRRTRIALAVLAGAVLLLLLALLVRAFAPGFTAQAVKAITGTLSVTITAPPPPEPSPAPEPAGGSGEAGKKTIPREVAVAKPKVPIAKTPAPQASSSGSADTSGARDSGTGTGAGGSGTGTGSGAGGGGQGGGGVSKPVHIAGRIDRAADFPIPAGGREARIGKSVILALTVNAEGRATACRIYKGSGLPETDEVTCRLARERLRFRPATNAAGEPVTGTFYWQQKFFF